MNNDIKISVIVPVYNVEAYLPKCLDSLLVQTLKEIEIICVNDGSTDRSAYILDSYKRQYEQVRVFEQHNQGLSAARNTGLQAARGEYVHFCDSDDWLRPETLADAYEKAIKDAMDVVFFGGQSFNDGADEQTAEFFKNHYKRKNVYNDVYKGTELYAKFRSYGDYFPSACLYITRRAFLEERQLVFFTGLTHEDELFTFQVMQSAARAGCLPGRYYMRRLRPGSLMTVPKTIKNVRGYFLVALGMLEYACEERNIYEEQIASEHVLFIFRTARSTYNNLDIREQDKVKEWPWRERMLLRLILQGELLLPELVRCRELYQQEKREKEVLQIGAGSMQQTGMIVYGIGAHLQDVIAWHPDIIKQISRVIDKDPAKIGRPAHGIGVVVEGPAVLEKLPKGQEIAIAAVRYLKEIEKEILKLNSGLVCRSIDDAWETRNH